MQLLSTIVFNPDTSDEQDHLVRMLTPYLEATRDDRLEVKSVERPTADGDEVTLYVIIHTGNLLGMVTELAEDGFL